LLSNLRTRKLQRDEVTTKPSIHIATNQKCLNLGNEPTIREQQQPAKESTAAESEAKKSRKNEENRRLHTF
jgi:hypothetical protein